MIIFLTVGLIKHYQFALTAFKVLAAWIPTRHPLLVASKGKTPTFMWKFLIGPRNDTLSTMFQERGHECFFWICNGNIARITLSIFSESEKSVSPSCLHLPCASTVKSAYNNWSSSQFLMVQCKVAQLVAVWQPGCEKMEREWENEEEMEGKWGNRGIHSLHFLFISSLSIHILYKKLSHFVAKCFVCIGYVVF